MKKLLVVGLLGLSLLILPSTASASIISDLMQWIRPTRAPLETVNPAIILTGPSTREASFKPGDIVNVRWMTRNYRGDIRLQITLENTTQALYTTTIVEGIRSHIYKLPADTASGKYIVQIEGAGGLTSITTFSVTTRAGAQSNDLIINGGIPISGGGSTNPELNQGPFQPSGHLMARISPTTPASPIVFNAGEIKKDVRLGTFEIKATDYDAVLDELTIKLHQGTKQPSAQFGNLRLIVGKQLYREASSSQGVYTFKNLAATLPKDAFINVGVTVDIGGGNSSESSGAVTLVANSIKASNGPGRPVVVDLATNLTAPAIQYEYKRTQTGTPSITILTPNGGETYYKGVTHSSTWKASKITTETRRYTTDLISRDGSVIKGGGVDSLSNLDPETKTSDFTIPLSVPSGQYKMRVALCSSTDCSTISTVVQDTSDDYFNVAEYQGPAIDNVFLYSGRTSETVLTTGTAYTISWIEKRTKDSVGVYLYKLIGSVWTRSLVIATKNSVGNGQGSATWTVPADFKIMDGRYKIYVETPGAGGGVEVTFKTATTNSGAAYATIDQSTLTTSGSRPTLSGYAYNITYPFGISISSASGDKVWASGNLTLNQDRWTNTVNQNLSPGTYQVYVSSNNITIKQGTLIVTSATNIPSPRVTSPNGSETFTIGNSYNIQWHGGSAKDGEKYRFELYNTALNKATVIAEVPVSSNSLYFDGTILWAIPNGSDAGRGVFKIRIVRASDGVVVDESDNSFTIVNPLRSISVTRPNEGETWTVGSVYEILWGSNVLSPTVKIYLSGGGHEEGYKKLLGTYSNTGYIKYTVTASDLPKYPRFTWKVMVCDSNDAYCALSGEIKIQNLSLIAPSSAVAPISVRGQRSSLVASVFYAIGDTFDRVLGN